ncbi:zf-HC2 domain-containing protein [Labedella endophytica]|jgi:anti-sigma factor (TIGR02949 family)|uniref:Alpha-ketoglutarate decarboxylase n=1 Tax=Labedella endophytica TaxID=1523160 RepID=A0A433JSC4_9MICO|nr:zf-HC2 domain-containing protein [Labedella endophytica]RUR01292.1 alpha-ketoglutarate decarboxylase [Labedella endophytica]
MSDCGCDKAKRDLEEFLRDEVCRTEAADIRTHLEHCESCRSEAALSVTLTEAVQRACKETAPADLRDQVLERLRAIKAGHETESTPAV